MGVDCVVCGGGIGVGVVFGLYELEDFVLGEGVEEEVGLGFVFVG